LPVAGRHAASIDGGGTPVQDSGTGAFKLRLAGVDKGNFVSARMRIQSVQVTSGGVVLANAPHTPEVDLAEMGQAYLLASFQPPAGVEDVEFAVSFESGTVATETASFSVDSRCQTLHLAGKVSKIAERKARGHPTRRGPIVRTLGRGADAGAPLATRVLAPPPQVPKAMPCASGRSRPQLRVEVCRRM